MSEARLLETIEDLAMGISTLSGQIRRVEKMMKRLETALVNPNLSANERAMRGVQLLLKQRIERQRASKP